MANQEVYVDNAQNFRAKLAVADEVDNDMIDWLSARGIDTLQQAYAEVDRVDWMIRLIKACGVAVQRDQCVGLAADCAEHVLAAWQAKFPHDARPARAIGAAKSSSAECDAAANAAAEAALVGMNANDPLLVKAGSAAKAAAWAGFAAEMEHPYYLDFARYAARCAVEAADSPTAEMRWQMDCLRRWF
jgi:hypothetical protein